MDICLAIPIDMNIWSRLIESFYILQYQGSSTLVIEYSDCRLSKRNRNGAVRRGMADQEILEICPVGRLGMVTPTPYNGLRGAGRGKKYHYRKTM